MSSSCTNPFEGKNDTKIACTTETEPPNELEPVGRYLLFQGTYELTGMIGGKMIEKTLPVSSILEIDTKTGRVWEFSKALISDSENKPQEITKWNALGSGPIDDEERMSRLPLINKRPGQPRNQ